MVNLTLPKEMQEVLDGNLMKGGLVSDDLLSKALYYIPEGVRLIGTACAQLRADKRKLERETSDIKDELELERAKIILGLDTNTYKSQDMREAKVLTDSKYRVILAKLREKERETEELMQELEEAGEYLWKLKNLQTSLDDLTRLRISEKRF